MPKVSKIKRKSDAELERLRKLDEEERALSSMLFGADTSDFPSIDEIEGMEERGDDRFVTEEEDDKTDVDKKEGLEMSTEEQEGPKWVDEDDAQLDVDVTMKARLRKLRRTRAEKRLDGNEYSKRLRARFNASHYNISTDWANTETSVTLGVDDEKSTKNDDSEDEDDISISLESVLQNSAPLTGLSADLPPNTVSIKRCRDANRKEYSDVTLQSVKFHASGELLLTAGFDKTLRFFRIDGKENSKVTGIYLDSFPIYSASFLGKTGNNTSKVVVSSRRNFYYLYDSVAGKLEKVNRIHGRNERSLEIHCTSSDGKYIAFIGNDGYILVVDTISRQLIAAPKLNGSVRSLEFSADSSSIYASGSDGEIYKFETRSWKCVERFSNFDGTVTQSLSASSRFLAVGAKSGVVNVFNADNLSTKQVRNPVKSVMNMQMSADTLQFNGDGQILAMSTKRKKDTLKLLHVPTMSVFSNWPTQKVPLGYVWSLDFSPNSGYLAVGNSKGKCLLFRLNHYLNN